MQGTHGPGLAPLQVGVVAMPGTALLTASDIAYRVREAGATSRGRSKVIFARPVYLYRKLRRKHTGWCAIDFTARG